jgi:rhamnogalacturonan endolyase
MTNAAKLLLLIALISALTVVPTVAFAQRQMERLGRGVIAVNQGGGKVFVSWRLLGDDPEATSFNLYRGTTGAKAVKLNARLIADVTFFVDEKADLTKAVSYFVRPVIKGREREASKAFTLLAGAPVRQCLEGAHYTQFMVYDLDGDGRAEVACKTADGTIDGKGKVIGDPNGIGGILKAHL